MAITTVKTYDSPDGLDHINDIFDDISPVELDFHEFYNELHRRKHEAKTLCKDSGEYAVIYAIEYFAGILPRRIVGCHWCNEVCSKERYDYIQSLYSNTRGGAVEIRAVFNHRR